MTRRIKLPHDHAATSGRVNTSGRVVLPESAPPTDPKTGGGRKLDHGKLRFSLFPIEALNPILSVLEYGAKKYAPGGWRHVPDARVRYADALHRHFVDYLSGKRIDAESGELVVAQIAVNAIFLIALDVSERTS